jgi:lysophospholipase L1-like esterase
MRGFVLTGLLFGVFLAPASSVSHAATAQPTVWNIVALGDSDATGEGDPTRLRWVGRYASLLRQKLGLKVVVTNLVAIGKTSRSVLSEIRFNPITRAAVKKARIVLVGIGGADLGAGDKRLEAGRVTARPATSLTCKRSGVTSTRRRPFFASCGTQSRQCSGRSPCRTSSPGPRTWYPRS